MEPAWEGAPGPRPCTTSVRVRELSWPGRHNPCPQSRGLGSRGDSRREQLVEEPLSPAQLQVLAQVDDLRLVRVLEMCVDTRESSLGHFGAHLPNLDQLKLNGSHLGSIRDLGTSLGRLQVLWLSRCGLADLDGVGSFPALKELYVSYNDVAELSPLGLLEQLEVLDLEGNCVGDLEQLRCLRLCPRLATLTLEGNLVCLRPRPGPASQVPRGYNYRAEVRKLIPQLHTLDELPAACTDLAASRKLDQDWLMVKEAIKEGSLLDTPLPRPGRADPSPGTSARERPLRDRPHGSTLWKLDPVLSLPETQPWALSLGPLHEGLLPEDLAPEDHASTLTHGAGQVLCGNPTKGLRERRRQGQAWAPPEQLSPRRPDLAPSPRASGPHPADTRDLLALVGLRPWRELGLRPLPCRQLEPQQEGATTPQDPRRAPEDQEGQAAPGASSGPPSLASEPSKTLAYHLTPSPPTYPMPPGSGSNSPRGSADLPFRGRRLRALGSLGPGLGEELAAVSALRALEVSSGPGPRAQGSPEQKPARDPAARRPASPACGP